MHMCTLLIISFGADIASKYSVLQCMPFYFVFIPFLLEVSTRFLYSFIRFHSLIVSSTWLATRSDTSTNTQTQAHTHTHSKKKPNREQFSTLISFDILPLKILKHACCSHYKRFAETYVFFACQIHTHLAYIAIAIIKQQTANLAFYCIVRRSFRQCRHYLSL